MCGLLFAGNAGDINTTWLPWHEWHFVAPTCAHEQRKGSMRLEMFIQSTPVSPIRRCSSEVTHQVRMIHRQVRTRVPLLLLVHRQVRTRGPLRHPSNSVRHLRWVLAASEIPYAIYGGCARGEILHAIYCGCAWGCAHPTQITFKIAILFVVCSGP